MASPYTFTDPRLGKLDGFQVEIDEARERADIILNRPPLNVVSMPERDQLRLVFETLDEDARVRVIVVRSIGEHFSSGGNIGGFMEATPEKVSKLAWNIASPSRCSKPVIVANRGYCFGVGFELSLACDFRLVSETTLYALPEQKLGQIPGSGGSARLQKMVGITRTKDIVMRSKRSLKKQRTSSLTSFAPSRHWRSERPRNCSTIQRIRRCRSQSNWRGMVIAVCASRTISRRGSRRSTPSGRRNSSEAELKCNFRGQIGEINVDC
jgi:hypothetical protein